MHPFMVEAVAKERRNDIMRAARRLGPAPEWHRGSRRRREPGRVRSALARPILNLALVMLGEEGHEVRAHLTERNCTTC